MTRFSEGVIPAFQFTPTEDGRIHALVRTWPHGSIKESHYKVEDAPFYLEMWEKDPSSYQMTEDDVEEFRLAAEMASV